MTVQPPGAQLDGFGLNPWLDQQRISDEQWDSYFRNGYLQLGPVADADQVERLKQRVDDLALGRVVNPDVRLQLDTGGRYEDLPEATEVTSQHTLLYRKVQGLETDDLFRTVLTHPILAEVAAHHYGRHTSATLFRAMVMNKPASQGTLLPWHQDGGDVWALDRDPLITIWMALDDATAANGCVEVLPGSHRLGLLSQQGSTISEEEARRHCPEDAVVAMEVPAGHAILMHNWLLHRSGINRTEVPRRAFTASYLDSRTRNILTGEHFPLILGDSFGPVHPYLEMLKCNTTASQDTVSAAEEYALSLRADNDKLHQSIQEATEYAHSLEAEVNRLQTLEAEVDRLRSLEIERLRSVAATPPSLSDFSRRTVVPAGQRLLQRGRVALGRLRSRQQ